MPIAAADLLNLLQLMRRQQDGQAVFAVEILDQLEDADRAVGIDAEGRFIENDRRGFLYQNFGDAQTLLHAAREFFDQTPAIIR